jgi:mRNA interferase RelE/StbE
LNLNADGLCSARSLAQFPELDLWSESRNTCHGKALSGPQLGTYWRYRVGEYRIICDIKDDTLCILVIELGNRREIYR